MRPGLDGTVEIWRKPAGMRVELDVFSGRSNPSWDLSDEEARAIVELLVDLPTTTAPVNEGRLGFRGFTLETPPAEPSRPHTCVLASA